MRGSSSTGHPTLQARPSGKEGREYKPVPTTGGCGGAVVCKRVKQPDPPRLTRDSGPYQGSPVPHGVKRERLARPSTGQAQLWKAKSCAKAPGRQREKKSLGLQKPKRPACGRRGGTPEKGRHSPLSTPSKIHLSQCGPRTLRGDTRGVSRRAPTPPQPTPYPRPRHSSTYSTEDPKPRPAAAGAIWSCVRPTSRNDSRGRGQIWLP